MAAEPELSHPAHLCEFSHRGPTRALDGLRVCGRHRDDIAGTLAAIVSAHRLLRVEGELPRAAERVAAEAKTPKRPHSPAPTRLDVQAMLDPRTGPMTSPGDVPYVPRELGVWCETIAQWRGVRPLSDEVVVRLVWGLRQRGGGQAWSSAHARVEASAAYLRRHHVWLMAQEFAVDYYQHLRAIHARLSGSVGTVPPRPFARCYSIVGDPPAPCDGPLRKLPDDKQVRCPRCGRIYVGSDLLRLQVVARSQ